VFVSASDVVMSVDIAGGYSSRSLTVSTESWIGHPMDPIGCLFSVLLDAAGGTSAENRNGELLYSSIQQQNMHAYIRYLLHIC